MTNRPVILICIVGAFFTFSCVGPPYLLADDSLADHFTLVHLASFEFTAYAHEESGSVLWLVGPDGDMRVEFLQGGANRSPRSALPALLDQNGRGWTAILNGTGDETINKWGEGWKFPPAGLGALVATIVSELQMGPPESTHAPQAWRAGSPSRRHQAQSVGSLEADGTEHKTFRSQQAARGYGRGGSDEVLHWYWSEAETDSIAILHLSASKWPGVLKMQLEASYAGKLAIPEVFVPLWPLRDLVTLTPNN